MQSAVRMARRRFRAVRRHWRRMGPGGRTILELNHDYRRTLFLVGSARSGSTWLSDLLEETLQCRVIFEPLRRDKVPIAQGVPWGFYADPDRSPPDLYRVMDYIVSGRVRSVWTDEANAHRLPRHRLVKEVRATNLLPWITRHFPGLPVVYLLRHPVPSALSAAALGWDPFLEEFTRQDALMSGPLRPFAACVADHVDGDLFHRHVLRWCMENFVPVHLLTADSVLVVFYEDLVEDPGREVARLAEFLRRFPTGRWNLEQGALSATGRASRTNYRDTPLMAPSDRLESWRSQVSSDTLDSAMAIVGAFDLDVVYGHDMRPLISPDQLPQGHRRGADWGPPVDPDGARHP
jgi:hypothetical protein